MIKAICDCGYEDFIGDFLEDAQIKTSEVIILFKCPKCSHKLTFNIIEKK